jgi:peptidyl-prolyl cis-trans isomerase SurA
MTVFSKAAMVVLFAISATTVHAQVLFTFGGKSVTKNDFLKAYKKNNTEAKPSDQSYADYLELYIRFKLKVQAALDMRLDTLPNQQAELNSFRNQIVETYMKDDASVKELVQEAMVRSKKDIHLAHIFVPVQKSATEEEIKKAQNKINAAYGQLQKGLDFGKVATEFSEDPTVAGNKSDIGYITVFVLPYDLENIVYSTPAGKYSAPVRSKAGFHIFKNLGERNGLGKLKAAQILLSFTPDATAAQKQQVQQQADSIYKALKNGSDFKTLATQLSKDNLTFQQGGEMMLFGVGQYDPVFESAAFALKEDGTISQPVLTSYGYHIIKRLQHQPIITDTANTAWVEEVKQKVLQSDRMEVSKKMLLKKVMQLTAYKKNPVNEKNLLILTDSVLNNKSLPKFADLNANTVLFSFAKRKVTVKDWQHYLETIRNYENMKAGKTKQQLYEGFVETTTFDYYRSHLEEYNKEFAYQLNEFKEGNLLFEIMQRKIWDEAATDSAGLQKYYAQHKDKYWWETSADAIIFTASNEKVAEETRKKLQENYKDWQKYIDNSSGQLQADSGRYELGQIPVAERTNFTAGLTTANVKNETDNSVAFAYIIKVYSNREPRNFADARGFVINDYQQFLEEKWVNELKKKYPLTINQTLVKTLPK